MTDTDTMCPESERQALRRARWAICLRIAVVMTLIVACIGGVVYFLMVAGQRRDVEHELTGAATFATIGNTPGCVYLIVQHNGALSQSPGTPAGLPIRAALDQVARSGSPLRSSVELAGYRYELLTQRRGADLVQVAYDTRFQAEDLRDLLLALAAAEAIGLVGAVLGGGFLSKRAMWPLITALGRQRRFVADASHELRTPLTQLHTRTQMLVRRARRGELAPEDLDTELDRIVAGTRQLGEVVDDLLLSTQLSSRPRDLNEVDLAAIVAQAVDAEAARAGSLGLTVLMREEPGSYVVAGVGSALRRVVAALLDNAIGHTPPGGEIVLSLSAQGALVRLSVRDTGVGLDPADAERIFERFARGTAGRGRRFGLGLALVREVVDNHQGSITAEGRPGEGATFTVLLPALPAVVPPASSSSSSSSSEVRLKRVFRVASPRP